MLSRLSLTVFPAILCFASPSFADNYPLTVTDGRGAEVTLTEKPNRVAALWVPAADLLVKLGQPVAGVTTYEGQMPVYLGETVSGALDLGDITSPNLELLASSDIHLTVGMTSYNAPYADQIEPVSTFLTYDSYRLNDAMEAVQSLGNALGAAEDVEKLNADFTALMADYASRAPEEAREVMLIWSYQDTLFGYQNGLTATDIIAATGATNPLGKLPEGDSPDTGFTILETEDLLAHDPDVILMFISHGGQPKYNPAYERMTAYKNGTFYSIGYQYSQPSGPIAREMVLREAGHLIYPDVFDAPELPETARAVPVVFNK
ncbi:ABC transporter substrate-binding protein [Shimia sp. MMG029]|uniref:ABC transporter substrate-binding protein n=1 Tax=Shimia sp. MMG029 TaxID=3021978 RepID=UPI0022FE2D31|nr:ABC transporter substrate-binding protein [Shimia sp. MMG029]MDA5558705.1 ABC transporter substrate-binding protein [Shimia sp. MMG029]